MFSPYCRRVLLSLCEGVDIERDEQSVEEMVGEHLIESVDVETEDVVEVVQVIQMLRHQIRQTVTTVVTEIEMKE